MFSWKGDFIFQEFSGYVLRNRVLSELLKALFDNRH